MKLALLMLRVLAIPTALVALSIIYDMSQVPIEHNTATVINKCISHFSSKGGGTRTSYFLIMKGQQVYEEGVAIDFYNLCSVNNNVELSHSPIFRKCWGISLIRGGAVVAQTSINVMFAGIGWLLLIPCLSLVPRIGNAFINAFTTNPWATDKRQINTMKTIWYLFFGLESLGIYYCFKLLSFMERSF
jgi:hypothetical protein